MYQYPRTLEAVLAVLEQAEAQGEIYNQAYKDLRESANRHLEAAFAKWSDPFYHGAYREKIGRYPTEGGYYDTFMKLSPQIHTISGARKTLTKDRKTLEKRREWDAPEACLAIEQSLDNYEKAIDQFEGIAARVIALKSKIKMGRRPSDDPRKTPERTLEHTGTCACGKNVKREPNGKLCDHGFTIHEGFGRNGRCFGVGRLPIEVSPEIWFDIKASAKMRITHLEHYLSDVYPGLTELTEMRGWGHNAKLHTVTREDTEWDRLYQARKHEAESELRDMQRVLRDTIAKIEEWIPRPLPEETWAVGGKRFRYRLETAEKTFLVDAPYASLVEIEIKKQGWKLTKPFEKVDTDDFAIEFLEVPAPLGKAAHE